MQLPTPPRLPSLLALATLAGALAPSAHAADPADCDHKPGERLRAAVVPAADRFAPGAPLAADLEVELLRAAVALRVDTAGAGVLAGSAREELLDGPWPAGSVARTVLDLPAVHGLGEGSLQVTVTALDAFDEPISLRRTTLHVLADAQGVWTSGSSETDLALRRLAFLRSAGQLSAGAYADAISAVSAGSAATDHTPHPAAPRTPAQELLDAAFAGAETAQPFGTGHALGSAGTVQGTVLWTDGAGNTHALPQAFVEARVGESVVASTSTDSAGKYSLGLGNTETVSVRVRVHTRSAVADIKPDSAGAATYFVQSAATDVAGGATETVNLTIGNTTDTESAFSVHSALVMIGAYAGTLAGTMPSTVDTRFPTTRHTSLFDKSAGQLHILKADRRDWDVIHHEYGHYFMNIHKFVNNPGGNHSFNTNMAAQPGRDKDSGTRLAWGEGWPTFFGIAGQSRMGAKALNIPNVGDVFYTDTEDSTLNIDVEASQGVGEDDELSVITSLWDLFDAARDGKDQVTLTDTSMFQSFKSSASQRMGDAWNALAVPMSKRDRTRAGAVLGQSNIAPELTSPPDKLEATNTPPKFTWEANGGGPPNPLNDFKVVFYDSDFGTEILSAPVGNATEFTPSQAQWDTIRAGGDLIRWVVEGKSTAAPATPGGTLDFYWSEARTIGGIGISFVVDDTGSMGEEIGAVRSALQLYIDLLSISLLPGEEPPTIQLVTFKDSVTERIVSKDLEAVKSAVAALTATGGSDCPEFGAQAVEFAGSSLSSGGIMLFATDASSQPGVDIGALIGQLKAKGIRVHTILSGDCEGFFSTPAEGLPPGLLVSGPQSWSSADALGGGPQKPEDDDPDQTGIDDPGQTPLDDHGNTPETATVLLEGAPDTGGSLSSTDFIDYFRFDLEAGAPYSFRFRTDTSSATVRLRDTDGTSILETGFANSTPRVLTFVPDEPGTYFLTLEGGFSTVPYTVGFREDPLALLTSAKAMFSTLSAETGGVFSVQDGVNFGETTEYIASVFNIMAGTVQPTVIVANPNDLPQGVTFSLSLTGNRTNWRDGTSVEILSDGVTVESVDVLDSTTLSARVTVAEDATFGFADVVVTTPLGGETEVASGKDIVEVVGPVTSPTLLSVQPANVSRGDEVTLTLFGAKTEWTEASTLALGDGVTVDSLTFVSSQELRAVVTIAEDAEIGFRTAQVTTDGFLEQQSRALFVFASDVGVAGIRQLSPSQVSRGSRAVVTVEVENLDLVEDAITADFGPDTEVLAVEIVDPLHAEVTVQVGLTAQIGFRDVSLTSDGVTAVIVKAFFVDDFASVRSLAGGTEKLSDTLATGGALAFEFEAAADDVLERVFVVPFGDGANGSVLPPDAEVSLLSPSGAVVASASATSAPADLRDVPLPEAGTYRIVVQDRGGSGGAYKGVALLGEEPTP